MDTVPRVGSKVRVVSPYTCLVMGTVAVVVSAPTEAHYFGEAPRPMKDLVGLRIASHATAWVTLDQIEAVS